VTNFREIFNDHIGAHVMAFVLHFARGPAMSICRSSCSANGRRCRATPAPCTCPKATALVVGVRRHRRRGGAARQHFSGMRVIGVDERASCSAARK